jgi:hypothetical protein
MKKFFVYCLLAIPGIRLADAQTAPPRLRVDVSTGYQQENFRWDIAGNNNGQNPNVLSELKWKKVGGQTLRAAVSYNFYNRLIIYGDYARQFISSGTVNDADYTADNRTGNTYNQTFAANKGNTSLWHLGVGYTLINTKRFNLTPVVGYGQNSESLRLLDKDNMYPGLNSSYSPKWKGGFLKLMATGTIVPKLKLKADVTYHQVSYNSDGNWNLITSFQHPVSYRHHANGYGMEAGGKLSYDITPHIALNLGGSYFNWQTGNGTDQLYLNNGEVDKTQLNGVHRNGFGVSAGLGFSW